MERALNNEQQWNNHITLCNACICIYVYIYELTFNSRSFELNIINCIIRLIYSEYNMAIFNKRWPTITSIVNSRLLHVLLFMLYIDLN